MELLYFIFGILFAYLVEPLLESFVGWLCLALESAKGRAHITIAKRQKEIDQIQEPPPTKSFQVGFEIPTPIEEEWEDEEDGPEGG